MGRYWKIFSVVVLTSFITSAWAAGDPCSRQEQRVRSANQNYQSAENNLNQQQNRLDSMQTQQENTIAQLQFQVDQAQLNANFTRSLPIVNFGFCNAFGGWNFRFVIQCAIQRQARRNLAVRRAVQMEQLSVQRLQSYQRSSQTQIDRQIARVTQAQSVVTQRRDQLILAEADLALCRQQNG